MSEKIIVAHHHLVCDICKRRIFKGSRCRMVRDDFMPNLIYFEHLRCPSAPTLTGGDSKPFHSIINNRRSNVLA